MFGYVVPFMPELKVKDKELYQAYYCGVCRALGGYGLSSKLTLSYDAAFAAVLLSGVTGTEPSFTPHGCAAHPVRGKIPVTDGNDVMDYCAALSVLLAKYKLLDDAADGRPIRKAAIPAIARGIKRAERKYPEAANVLAEGLKKLGEIENKAECDPDDAPIAFGALLGELFALCPGVGDGARGLLVELGKKIGGFVYIIDAWDDRKEDEKKGCYNIFLRSGLADPRGTCSAMLDMSINDAVLAYDLMEIRVNKPLLDNVMYMGLCAKASEVLGKDDRGKEEKA